MTEFQNNAEFDKNKEIQTALKKYGASIEQLTMEYPIQGHTPPTYETPRYDIEEPDGNPLEIDFMYFPEGTENHPEVKYTTIVVDRVNGAGKWVKNYHMHEALDGTLAWEKSEWFDVDPQVAAMLEKGTPAPEVSKEQNPVEVRDELNTADLKAQFATLAEAVSKVELEVPTPNEVAMLQGYIDQLI